MNKKEKTKTLMIALDPIALLGHLHNAIAKGDKSTNLKLNINEKENEDDPDYANEFAVAWL